MSKLLILGAVLALSIAAAAAQSGPQHAPPPPSPQSAIDTSVQQVGASVEQMNDWFAHAIDHVLSGSDDAPKAGRSVSPPDAGQPPLQK